MKGQGLLSGAVVLRRALGCSAGPASPPLHPRGVQGGGVRVAGQGRVRDGDEKVKLVFARFGAQSFAWVSSLYVLCFTDSHTHPVF